jgi:hypothetical protein
MIVARGAKRPAAAAAGTATETVKHVGTECVVFDAASGRRLRVEPALMEASRRTGGAHLLFGATGRAAAGGGASLFRRLFIEGRDASYPNPMTGVPVIVNARRVRVLVVWTKDVTRIDLAAVREALAARRARGEPLFALRVNLAITCAGPELERDVPPWREQLACVRDALWPFLRAELRYDADALAEAVRVRVDPVGPWRRLAGGAAHDPVRAQFADLVAATVALGIANVHFSFFQADGVWSARIAPKMRAAGFELHVLSDEARVAYIREVILPVVLEYPDLLVTTCTLRGALLREAAGERIEIGACVPERSVYLLGAAVDWDVPAQLGRKKAAGSADRTDLCTCVAIRDIGFVGTRTGRAYCPMDCAYCFTGPGKGSWAAAVQPRYEGTAAGGAAAACDLQY